MRTEDGHIIYKCLNGEPEAFGFLVDKYKESIYGFAYAKLLNFHDAEDVTQEVFIKAYQKLRTLKRFDSFLAWLYSITSNLCKTWIRARSRRPDGQFMEDKDPELLEVISIDSYRNSLARESLNEEIQDALESLPEMYRQVLTLYYFSGMNYREIARFLGASPMTILKRLSRARSQLKEEMLAMMTTTFKAQKLRGGFTFRILEAVKRIRIQPMPRATALPWGLSFATGIIITMLSLSPHLSILNPLAIPAGSPLPVEAKALKAGEIPVDILRISQMPAIASKQGDGDDGVPTLPEPPKAAPMAALGEGDTWTRKTDMPTARVAACAAAVDGRIYVIGGEIANGVYIATVEEYNPITDSWTKKSDMPTARGFCSASECNGKIYVIGGITRIGVFVSTVEEYNPATDKWTKKADMPTVRGVLSTSVANGKIYAIGGTRVQAFLPMLSTVEEYDPTTDEWIKKADMPTTRCGLSTSVVNGKIYAIGGWTGDAHTSVVEEYDPTADEWTKRANMPTRRMYFPTSVVGGKVYAIGGQLAQDPPFSKVEEYDPATDTWTSKTDMPTARTGLSAVALGGKIYAVGGGVTGIMTGSGGFPAVPNIEEYDTGFVPTKKTSSIEAKGKLVTSWGETKSD